MKRTIGFSFPPRTRLRQWKIWINELYWNIRYAWQRAWRGYDSVEVFELGPSFLKRMPVLLDAYMKSNIGLFDDPMTGRPLSMDETNAVIKKMIWFFEGTDEAVARSRRFGDEVTSMELSAEQNNLIFDDITKNRNAAMELFSAYLPSLWN